GRQRVSGRDGGSCSALRSASYLGTEASAHYQDEIARRRIMLFAMSLRWLFHPNVVGSSTMVTDQTGAVVQDTTYYPWGQLWQSPGSFGGNWNFAAFGVLEPTTTLYPTPFRRYSSTLGRWTAPDPLGGDIM